MPGNTADPRSDNASDDEPQAVTVGASSSLPAQAVTYFEQFPEGQFTQHNVYNADLPGEAKLESDPSSSYPPQPLEDSSHATGEAPSHVALHPQHAAQWSTQELNPFIPHFPDPELDRTSSGSSVTEEGAVVGESGRTYHGYKDGVSGYLLPNDAAEQDRLDFQHAMMGHLWGGRLVLSPLPRAPRLVLDVATGTGIWALEFARANPTSFVVGTDLSKIQPVPDVPNCLFEKMDCEEDWLWTYEFDYVHIRMIVTAIRNPKRLIEQAFESLNPGGWIELQDADMDLLSKDGPERDDRVSTSFLKKWFDLSAVGAAAHGIDLHKAKNYKTWLIEAGCECNPAD
jgi:SAM-dependent methyltransferase